MKVRIAGWLSFLFCIYGFVADGQQIKGLVVDMSTNLPLNEVNIFNVFTNTITVADSLGGFTINVAKGQLIEFSKPGYITEKIRIPTANMPPFLKVYLKKPSTEQPYIVSDEMRWKEDSFKNSQLYHHFLEIPRLTGYQAIEHPFSAMSKTNREIWAFQDEFASFQQERYIDYIFNDRIINSLTGLKDDSIKVYKKTFRPTYEQLRSMGQYDFYNYIMKTVQYFREGLNPKRPYTRGSH